jgi:hypothetical protein
MRGRRAIRRIEGGRPAQHLLSEHRREFHEIVSGARERWVAISSIGRNSRAASRQRSAHTPS